MGDGSNGGGGHQRGKTGCLTGQPNLNGRAFGISLDQAIANEIGKTTRFKSLNSSVFVKGTLRDGLIFSGPQQMVVPEDDPGKLFTQMFSAPLPTPTGGTGPDPAAQAEFERLRTKKKSVLDRTLNEYQRMSAILGGGDRARLGIHMDAIRAVERGISTIPSAGAVSASCKKPDAAPSGAGFVETGKAHMDLLTLALACDLTRVASLQWRSSVTAFTWVNVSGDHHGISHQQGSAGADASLSRINKWFVDQAAYFLGRLKAFGDAGRRQPARQHPVLLAQRAGHRQAPPHPRALRDRHGQLQAAGGQDAGDRALPQVPGRHPPHQPADQHRAHDGPVDHQLRRNAVAQAVRFPTSAD